MKIRYKRHLKEIASIQTAEDVALDFFTTGLVVSLIKPTTHQYLPNILEIEGAQS